MSTPNDPRILPSVFEWYRIAEAAKSAQAEIERAIRKHGQARTPLSRDIPLGEKLAILVEEVGEVAKALTYDHINLEDMENLKKELDQVAAVAMMWRASL